MKNIYVCGPTVYSKAHIGNLRPIITFDIYIRSLKSLGNDVNFIHNITDIDDKIIAAALQEKTTETEISDKYKKYYLDLLKRSNVNIPENMPGVVENMGIIVEYISKLVELKNAYEVNGSVYFDTTSVEGYGKISNRDINNNIDKENKDKKHQADFAIWKATKEGVKYDSPWGRGRPGWHTECTVFINKILKGESLDIHGGGIDLLFPHHENENIQYKAVNKKEITKEWRHIGKLNIDGEKMSKSIGNIMDATDFMNQHGEDVLRMLFITTSYSAPININNEMIQSSIKTLKSFKNDFIKAQTLTNEESEDIKTVAKLISEWKFAEAMKAVNEEIKLFRKEVSVEQAKKVIAIMKLIGFGFSNITLSDKDKNMFVEWNILREKNKYDEADKVRKELIELGLI